MKENWKAANKYYKENQAFVDNIHTNKSLNFTFLCDGGMGGNARKFYKSSVINGSQSSEYGVMAIEGRMAFVRTSNHWGTFSVRGDNGIYEMHCWELKGAPRKRDGGYKNTSQTGYIFINEIEEAINA